METAIDLTGSSAEIEALVDLARRRGDIEVSEPTALDASRALNAGLDPVTIGAVLTFITLVFKTGTAALEFLKAVREEMKARKAAVAVTDSVTGRSLTVVKAATADAELEQATRT